jgi:hypothetical protein
MAKKIALGGTAAIGAWQCHDVPNTKTERQLLLRTSPIFAAFLIPL